MKLVKAWDEEGVGIPAPYQRRSKVVFAPGKEGVEELTSSHAILPPPGRTDYHEHDRPEMIYAVAGSGIRVHEGQQTPITADIAMWAPAGERHQIVNTGYEPLKPAAVFIPDAAQAERAKQPDGETTR